MTPHDDLFAATDASTSDVPQRMMEEDITGASMVNVVPCVWDADFWSQCVAQLIAVATENPNVPLTRQLVIVPDNSMITPYRAAWAQQAQSAQQAYALPPMMTLMDWAKANGAEDWDARHTERTLAWMQMLPALPQLRTLLGRVGEQALSDAQWITLAQQLIAMSDELSLHLLTGQSGQSSDAVQTQIKHIIESIYTHSAHEAAAQELAVLLHCWQADVDAQTPVIRYLAVLNQLVAQSADVAARPFEHIWVLRNRPWSAHEARFWQQYAQQVPVTVWAIQNVRVQAGAPRHAALSRWAGADAARYVLAENRSSIALNEEHPLTVYRAAHIEDEAQAAVQQVLRWRAQGLRQVGLVALDRQVSRRVGALLARVGVRLRDDTGWLLSTARAATAWATGLELLHGEVSAQALTDWFAHPMVLAQQPERAELLRALQRAADAQNAHKPPRAWQTWNDWLSAVQSLPVATESADAVRTQLLHELKTLQAYAHQWQSPRTLSQWAQAFIAWAQRFGLWQALSQDNAGAQWCAQMLRWQWIEDSHALSLNTALALMRSEVEQMTYRPPQTNEAVSDEAQTSNEQTQEDAADANADFNVILLPLGNTRLRLFDAVWLLGADAGNLPGSHYDAGLLNRAVRLALGLPTVEDKHAQMRLALLDVCATHARVMASYAQQKDGTPNALSPWLQQYVRVSGTTEQTIERRDEYPSPILRSRSSARVVAHVPERISATDIASIAACPYQFYARQVLRIAPQEWPQAILDNSALGLLWHRSIEHFHRARADAPAGQSTDVVNGVAADTALFEQVLEQHILPLCALNPQYWPVYERLKSYIPSFIQWWHAREAQGWRVFASEYWRDPPPTQMIVNESGEVRHNVRWSGRIDQVDERLDEQGRSVYSLIDYKSNVLKDRRHNVAAYEDHQLAFYVQLMGDAQPVEDARYVGVNTEQQKQPEVTLGDATQLRLHAQALYQRVNDFFLDMMAGVPLSALGEKGACSYCDYRAVCRKDYTPQIQTMNAETERA